MKRKILVVDDEPDIIKIVKFRLVKEGFEVVTAMDGEAALEVFDMEKPHLVILDLMLPKLDGYEVCRLLRQNHGVPIIILSAKGDEVDRLMGFRLGGDDYLVKPFSPSELVMRVNAVLRRCEGSPAVSQDTGVVIVGALSINRHNHEVRVKDKIVFVTPKEFNLLWLLASRPNQVFTREELLEIIWDSDYLGDTDNVTVMVSRLREKLKLFSNDIDFVKTVWGVGYKLSSE